MGRLFGLKARKRWAPPVIADSDLQAWVDRAGLRLNQVQADLFDVCIATLKTATPGGTPWTIFDGIWLLSLRGGRGSAVNFRSPSYTPRPKNNAVQFPGSGWQGDTALNCLLDLGYPLDGTANLKQDDATIVLWPLNDGLDETAPVCVVGASTAGADAAKIGLHPNDRGRLRAMLNNLSRPNLRVSKSAGMLWASRNGTDDGAHYIRIGNGTASIKRLSPTTATAPGSLHALGDSVAGHGSVQRLALVMAGGGANLEVMKAVHEAFTVLFLGLGVIDERDDPDPVSEQPNFMSKAMTAGLGFDTMMQSASVDDSVTETNDDDWPRTASYSPSQLLGASAGSIARAAAVWASRKNDGFGIRPNAWRYKVGQVKTSGGYECRTEFSSEQRAFAETEAIVARHCGADDAMVAAIVTGAGMAAPISGADATADQAAIDATFTELILSRGTGKEGGLPQYYACAPIDTVILPPWKLCDAAAGASSATALAIGTGAKTLTTQGGKPWIAGERMLLTSAGDPANWMVGRITAYAGATLTLGVIQTGGSGTHSDWQVRPQPRIVLDYECKDGRDPENTVAFLGRLAAWCAGARGGPFLLGMIPGALTNVRQIQSGLTIDTLWRVHQLCFDIIYLQIVGSATLSSKRQLEDQLALLRGPAGDQPVDYTRLAVQFAMGPNNSGTSVQQAIDAWKFISGVPGFRSDGSTTPMFGVCAWAGGEKFGGDVLARQIVQKQFKLLFGDIPYSQSVGEAPSGAGVGLIVDFERNDLITQSGGAISQIDDVVQGTAFVQATGGNKPTLGTMSNGRQCAVFSGNQWLRFAGQAPGLPYGTAGLILGVVGEADPSIRSVSSSYVFLAYGANPANTQRTAALRVNTGVPDVLLRVRGSTGASTLLNDGTADQPDGVRYALFYWNADNTTVYSEDDAANFSTPDTVAFNTTTNSVNVTIGASAQTTPGTFFNGKINYLEAIAWTTDAAALAKLRGRLAQRAAS